MRGPKLDRIDRRILQLLQANGRMTNIALARRVGISPPPCLRRVRAWKRPASSAAITPNSPPEALGFAVTVFAQIGLSSQAEKPISRRSRTWSRPGPKCARRTCSPGRPISS